MERGKRKKSKMACLFGGNGENPKRVIVQSGSRSDAHLVTQQDLFKREMGQSSAKQVMGTPMKNLIAKEMSNEITTKKRSPSIIAKLMGLDGLPSPLPNRQQRRLSNSSDKSTRKEKLFNGESNKNCIVEQQQFKDVYEDPEASHFSNQHYSSQACAKRKVTKKELAYAREKCDEAVWETSKIKNKLERVDSNSELMLNFLQHPDSLFVKHLHDQQGTLSSSLCSHIAVLKPSNALRHKACEAGWKEEKETSKYRNHSSHRRREDGLLGYSRRCINNSHRSSRVKLEAKEESYIPPTRIVVLKPNVAKSYHAMNTISSPDRKNMEFYSSMTGESGSLRYKKSPVEVRPMRHKSREAREIAREITSRVKEGFGYVGNDSFYNTPGSDSSVELERTSLSSRNSFDLNDRSKASPSKLFDSSVNREAKKRMSEMWKMTHGYKDVRMVDKGSTLGEMLSIPDNKMRSEKLDAVRGSLGATGECVSPSSSGMPLGISSQDGWRDADFRVTPRSRSLPPSFRNQNHGMSGYHDVHSDGKVMVYNEPCNRGRSRAVRGNCNHREDSFTKSVRYKRRCRSSQHRHACNTSTEFSDSLPDSCSNEKATETYSENDDLAEQQPFISEIHDGITSAACMVDAVISELTPELSRMSGALDSCAVEKDGLNPQEPSTAESVGSISIQSGPEPESSESSKEVDDCSPISVLEVPATEDVSSGSDCFERVNSQIHELRKQLELLKMDSGSTGERLTSILDDEEIEQGSSATPSGFDNWESSYLEDVLHCSGFYDTDPYTFMSTWYNVDCPLDPWLFDRLEKKYCEETIVSRSERRLVYDRINEAILGISKLMVSCSWVNPRRRGVQMTLPKFGFEDQLHKLLAKQEKEADEEYFEEIYVDNDPDWFQPLKEVDILGKEIAESLVNDLVLEVLTV